MRKDNDETDETDEAAAGFVVATRGLTASHGM